MENEKLTAPEKIALSRRELLLKTGLTLPFIGLAYRLWDLQITNRESYLDLSQGNRIRLKFFSSPRGLIYDRNNLILATNKPSYNINMTKEDVDDPLPLIKKISSGIGADIGDMLKNLEKNKHTPSFTPFIIAEDISWDQMSYMLTYASEFPGFEIDFISKRFYPGGTIASHLLGHMGGISKDELAQTPKEKNRSSQTLGKSGIEKIYNEQLIGLDGGVQVEVDSQGRNIRDLALTEPVPGKNVVLTIDKRLQQDIERRFADYTGSAVVTDIKTNEVLAMVSMPSYDPNKFSLGIEPVEWNRLLRGPEKPLNNRAIQGIYSPGSTFKMVMAYAALDMGLITADSPFVCNGSYRNHGQTFNCWKSSGHGKLHLVEALEQSCNVFFYNVGNLVGIDKINEYAHRLGLGEITGIELENELSGIIPSPEWKKKNYGNEWVMGETISVSIGQSYVSVTPLQLVCYLNTLLRNGVKIKPQIVKAVTEINQQNPLKVNTANNLSLEAQTPLLNPEYVNLIKTGMGEVINGKNGTARSAASAYIKFGGKTGTTQVISNKTKKKILDQGKEIDKKLQDHSWFVGFAPYSDPKISMSVMLEHGQKSSIAAEFAKDTFEFYWREIAVS